MSADAIMREAQDRQVSFRRDSMASAVETEEQRQDHELAMRSLMNTARRESIGFNGMYGRGMPFCSYGVDPMVAAGNLAYAMMPYGSLGRGPFDPLSMPYADPMMMAQMASMSAMTGYGSPLAAMTGVSPFAAMSGFGSVGMGLGLGSHLGFGGLGLMNPLSLSGTSMLNPITRMGLGGYGLGYNPMLQDVAARTVMNSQLIGGIF